MRARTRRVANTMALGGVATGSMNPHDAAMVAGTIKSSGCTWVTDAIEPSTGSTTCASAVLDASSLKKHTAAHTAKRMTSGGAPANPASCPPKYCDAPDS